MGIDQRLYRGCAGQPGLQLDDRRPDLRHLSRARREALCRDRLHARGALDQAGQPYQHEWRPGSGELRTGWAYPPKDYDKWGELVFQWVKHCIDRYGSAEVASWYFETWNEANLPQYYWGGTRDEFFRMHDVAVRAVRRALPTARVGGPDIAGTKDDFSPPIWRM
jgi:hypothetical protein